MKSLRELCLATDGGQNFSPERLLQMEDTLRQDHRTDMPWYLRVIVAIGAWLASCFFLGFAVAFIGWQDNNQSIFAILGILLLSAAVVIGRQSFGIFVDQCALAVCLAAQVMIYYGCINEHVHPLATATVLSIALAGILYATFPNLISRIMTCLLALQVTLLWIYCGDGELFSSHTRVASDISSWILLYWAVHLAGIAWCFLKPRHGVQLAPLGYALVASLAAWQIENLFNVWDRATIITYNHIWAAWIIWHFRTGLTALTLFGVATWAAGGRPALREKTPLFIGLALALATLVIIGSGGVLLTLLFMLLGFSLQNRPLLGLGLILFPIFLIHYYHNLNLDLLAKSCVLIGSGSVLLLLRTGLTRWATVNLKEVA